MADQPDPLADQGSAAPPSRPDSRLATRAVSVATGLGAAAMLAVGLGGYAFLASDAGVGFVLREIASRSGGAVTIEGVSGSLLDRIRAQRIVWQGETARFVANDVVLDWTPAALWSRGLVIAALEAKEITLDVETSATDIAPPASLALPFEVTLDRLEVERLAWHVGPNAGTVTSLAFGYRGGATEHRITGLELAGATWKLAGGAAIGATAPFPVSGELQLHGAQASVEGSAKIGMSGTLASLAVAGAGAANGTSFTLQARLAPLAAVPLRTVDVDATAIDLQSWDPTLHATRIDASIRAAPAGDGVAGTFTATNHLAGPFDAGKLPLRSATARYGWGESVLTLDDLEARLTGSGSARGQARIPLGTQASGGTWSLMLDGVDLSSIHSSLVATQLAGRVDADLASERRRVSGNIRDQALAGGIAVDFAASIADETVAVERLRAQAGTGTLEGQGRIALSGDRAYAFEATTIKLDPARFGAFPKASLDTRVTASGTAGGKPQATFDISVADGSQLRGLPLSGRASATVSGNAPGAASNTRTSTASGHSTASGMGTQFKTASEHAADTVPGAWSGLIVRDLRLAIDYAGARVTAEGSVGTAADMLTATLELPRLGALAPLFADQFSGKLLGAVSAQARWRGAWPNGSGEIHASGSALALGSERTAQKLDLDVALGAPAPGVIASDLLARTFRIDANANDLVGPQGRFRKAKASASGTLAAHALSLTLDADEMGLSANARGGLANAPGTSLRSGWRWTGVLERLDGHGPLGLALKSPASIELAPDYARLGEARLAIADGTLDISEFTWNGGRITTHGSVAAVPLATVARLAGAPLPVGSTLTLGGDWSVAANPRLNGTINVRRDGGDLLLDGSGQAGTPARIPLGITKAEIVARLRDDAVAAEASILAADGNSATANLTLGVAPDATPGQVGASAQLALSGSANFPSLQWLRHWIGTSAVLSGRARASAKASGTLARVSLAGSLEADALRLDAPPYGVSFKDGRLRARLADGRLTLDEFVLNSGGGEFRASGILSSIAPGAATLGTTTASSASGNITDPAAAGVGTATAATANASAQINWRANRFRLLNRPDLHLTVEGDGALALAQRKLVLSGNLKALDGNIAYESDPEATLGADVVVKGWAPAAAGPRAQDLPLEVDLALDLGNRLHFAGEGLDTGLRGLVRVTTGPRGLMGKGSIRSVNGTYRAFGQRLVIDPGRLIFDGPLDNPGLDIVALRKNLAVEAGVAVTGTVRVPVIRLTSEPPVTDSEKLAWLVLGHGLEGTSGPDLSALQAASSMLLGRNSKPITTAIAETVGVDDISFKPAPASASGGTTAQGGVVAIGKRITNRLSLIYEQGLTVANSAVKLEYALNRNVTLRASTGVVSNVGIQFQKSFE